MAGDKVEILPDEIRLTLGRAATSSCCGTCDDVPQIFGPTLMMPGQSFRLPFAVGLELPVRLHGAPERTDDHRRRSLSRDARGRGCDGARRNR